MRLATTITLAAACVLTLAACGSGAHATHAAARGSATSTTVIETTTTAAGAVVTTTTSTPAPKTYPNTTMTTRTSSPPPSAPTTTAAPAGTVVSSTNNASYGAILVDGRGRTLYLFTPDDGTSSPQCTGSCAATWPPLKASGTPRASGGAQQSLLGVESGQVTYNGHPLYLYAGDSAAGQTNGQGVGGIWYVVNTSGNPVLH